jgi:pyruvate ferredoxin oxidoreductase alpha subunit
MPQGVPRKSRGQEERQEMSPKKVMEGSEAVAEAVMLCGPEVIPVYPITPQTHIAECIARMVANGEFDAEIIRVESEQSAMAACIGAQATGVQAYTATASQGIALMHEILFIAAGMRLPVVMSVANRSLSAPLSIWNDQQDSFSQRDTGWIQLYVEDAQEAFDTHIQAFRIARESSLPVMVCLDGFVISHTYEPVELLPRERVRKFIGEHKPLMSLDPRRPSTMGALATPDYYMKFRKQVQDAVLDSGETIKRVSREFGKLSGRSYGNGLIEEVGMKGKKHALITIGSVAGTARERIEKEDVGIIKVKSLRPFPGEELRDACGNLESVGVIEKAISPGAGGALYEGVKSALYSLKSRPKVLGVTAGLGGRDITLEDISGIMGRIKRGSQGMEWLLD